MDTLSLSGLPQNQPAALIARKLPLSQGLQGEGVQTPQPRGRGRPDFMGSQAFISRAKDIDTAIRRRPHPLDLEFRQRLSNDVALG